MARNESRNVEEPNTAPEADRWYNISLGSSFKDHSSHPSSKLFTLRYEFKPASIDKTQPGSLKCKNNKVTVEYQNNQYGKPKVTFEGVSEDCKENDAVLFFDGETLRLERLNRAVNRLRHVRLPGESATAPAVENYSPPVNKVTNQLSNRSVAHQMQVQVDPVANVCLDNIDAGPSGVHDIDIEKSSGKGSHAGLDIDINLPHQADSDNDEIADVDITDDEVGKGPNAAEALRAQVNAQERKKEASSSSTSSATDTSESNSGCSSSDRESSENDSEISI